MSAHYAFGAMAAMVGLAALGSRRGARNVEGYLYHATSLRNLRGPEGIGRKGLQGSARSIASHFEGAQPQVFLTGSGGFIFWWGYVWNPEGEEDGDLPVALRVPLAVVGPRLETDRWGTKDADAAAWRYPGSVQAQYIEVWTGEAWVPVSEHAQIQTSDEVEYMREGGEALDSNLIPPELW